MRRVSRKSKKVKKKKKARQSATSAKKKRVVKKPAKKKTKPAKKTAKKVSRPAKTASKPAKKKKTAKKRTVKRKAKAVSKPAIRKSRPLPSTPPPTVAPRGELRDFADSMLGTPQAQAQMMERMMEKLPHIFLPGMVETDESLIMQRLIRAEQLGVFDETARQSALDYDWNLRDVYELWHSPDVYF